MSARTASSVAMIADGLVDRQQVAVGLAGGDVPLRGEGLVLHAASLDLGRVLLEHRAVGARRARNEVGVYQTASMSIRASVPMTWAVLGPAAWDAESDVDTAPEAWVKMVATSLSAPVGPRVALAAMVVGCTEDVPRERDRVDAEVEQRAAAELEGVQPVRGVGADAAACGRRGPRGSRRARRRR